MKDFMTTKDVCEELGVSRSWVNAHLRDMGEPGWENQDRRWIFYDRAKILNYINKNATIVRQTEFLDLTEFVSAEELDRKLRLFDKMPDDNERDTAREFYIRSLIPDQYQRISDSQYPSRNRGEYPWYPDKKAKITQLHHLVTMADLREQSGLSSEMIYRNLFSFGIAKVLLHGRVWFLIDEKSTTGQQFVFVCRRRG